MSSSTPMPPSSTIISEQMRAELSSQALLANDHTSQQLGMTVERVAPGFSRLRMKVSEDMLNGHASCHGGYIFTLADSAFAFACNSFNQVAVAASAAIEFLAPAYLDDVLTAESSVQSQGSRTGLYDVVITNQRDERVALFRGRSHRLGRTLFDEEHGANER